MSAPIRVELHGCPPSEAVIGGCWSRTAVRRAVEPWTRELADQFRGEQLPAHVDASVQLHFADRRKRNPANWKGPVQRLLADALGDRLAGVEVAIGRRRKRAATVIELVGEAAQ